MWPKYYFFLLSLSVFGYFYSKIIMLFSLLITFILLLIDIWKWFNGLEDNYNYRTGNGWIDLY